MDYEQLPEAVRLDLERLRISRAHFEASARRAVAPTRDAFRSTLTNSAGALLALLLLVSLVLGASRLVTWLWRWLF